MIDSTAIHRCGGFLLSYICSHHTILCDPIHAMGKCFVEKVVIFQRFMCLNPIHIVNSSHYRSYKYTSPVYFDVPCGHCSECNKTKNDDMFYRTYYHTSDWLSHIGQYIYCDTLTYDNEHLPNINSFLDTSFTYSCFNRDHLDKFFKDLRRQLEYHYSVKGLQYFLSAEYGTTEGKTHRPHYHIMLFVPQGVSVFSLSTLISKLWTYGRTEGLPYKDKNYIVSHNYIDSPDNNSYIRCSWYIQKYMRKDSSFQLVLNQRLADLHDLYYESDKDSYNLGVRCVKQFTLKSKHFGISALRDLDLNKVLTTGMVSVPNFDKVGQRHIKLPKYYYRYLFKDKFKVDGKVIYGDNDIGVKFKRNLFFRNIDFVANRYKNAFDMLDKHYQVDISRLLGSSSWRDFAVYVLSKRGYRFGESVSFHSFESLLNDEEKKYFCYASKNDKELFPYPFYSDSFCGNDVVGYSSAGLSFKLTPISSLQLNHSNYDRIYDILSGISIPVNQSKDAYGQHIEHLKYRFDSMRTV